MAYSDFHYPAVLQEFQLTEASDDLFSRVPDVTPSVTFRNLLPNNTKLANLIHTDKARSELLTMPMLSELWGRARERLNLSSGTEFSADPDAGLCGYVDFMIGLGPQLPRMTAPVVIVVEAKRDSIPDGFGQCIAGMVGAMRFGKRAGKPTETVYGVVTTGINWKFLRLTGSFLTFDESEITIGQPERILGILAHMVGGVRDAVAA